MPLTRYYQASTYGKCIVADYNNVHKDKCMTDFLRLKQCYVVRLSEGSGKLRGADNFVGGCEAEIVET